MGNLTTALLVVCSFSYLVAVIAVIVRKSVSEYVEWYQLGALGVSLLVVWGLSGIWINWTVIAYLAMFQIICIVVAYRVWLKNYGWIGSFFWVSYALLLIAGLTWGTNYLISIPVSSMTKTLLLAGLPLLVFMLPSGVLQAIEQFEIVTKERWRALPKFNPDIKPWVSLHVPVHSEPPDMVIETLQLLAAMDYANFEVIVVDNNTEDAGLWQPVKECCHGLGSRFRFYRLVNLPGAKAGALNFALAKTDSRATIIGVVDSDYHARSDFLKRLVGYFDNPKVGFVQTPHDYRRWQNNLFLRMCYWEYKLFFYTTMVALHERGAGLTVGTMCLIRKKALEEVGGWAEWCVTEDSELAIRIHGSGYESVYITETYGRGLIPETFAGYKKQRFRWTAGPIQELKYHFFRLWPGLKHSNNRYSFWQRWHHLNHGLDRANVGIGILFTPFLAVVIMVMVAQHEVIHVPFELWLASTVMLLTQICLTLFIYMYILKASFKDTLGALWASKALTHVIASASIFMLFNGSVSWDRTDKFQAMAMGLRSFMNVKTELSLAIVSLAFTGTMFALLPKTGLVLMLLIGFAYRVIDYLAAPALALIAEWSLVYKRRLT